MTKAAPKSTALWVLRRLRRAGYQALFAGGCVRDMLLHVRCSDYDIATDATPRQVKKLFPRVLLVGAKFGVAMVLHRGRTVEVATFRSDESYRDGRRPDRVRFTSAREDALRRDFTINGMFLDPISGEVIDYVGGRKDLAAGIIRTIGPAGDRFGEDYLRMLRAVRFSAKLDFAIVGATASAIRAGADRISRISGERIFDELSKMLSDASAASALDLLKELHLAEAILPELFAKDDLWRQVRRRVAAVSAEKDSVTALGAMLGDLPTRTILKILRGWGASNELRDAMCYLARNLGQWPRANELPLCDFKRLMARGQFRRLLRLWSAEERLETGRETLSRRAGRRAKGIAPEKVSPAPLISGEDIKGMGLSEGPALGRILRQVYEAQLNETLVSSAQAMQLAEELIGATADDK